MKDKPVTGILWWKSGQWEKAKSISSDPEAWDDSYEDWKEGAEKAMKNIEDLGITVVKVEIDLDEMKDWCRKQNLPMDSKARSRFVTMKIQEQYE